MDEIHKINVSCLVDQIVTHAPIQSKYSRFQENVRGSNVGHQANPVVFFVIVDIYIYMKDMIVPSIPVFFGVLGFTLEEAFAKAYARPAQISVTSSVSNHKGLRGLPSW